MATTYSDLLQPFKRLHLGCGPIILNDFLNIDDDFSRVIRSELISGRVYYIDNRSAAILCHDLSKGIPADNNFVELIYHSHFLEHLTMKQGESFIAECFRVMGHGAIMRIAVPDFQLWSKNYLEKRDEFFNWYRSTYLGNNRHAFPTNASVFSGMLYNWGHRMFYDEETLVALLERAGFRDISVMAWGQSRRINSILDIEGQSERSRESLVVECLK